MSNEHALVEIARLETFELRLGIPPGTVAVTMHARVRFEGIPGWFDEPAVPIASLEEALRIETSSTCFHFELHGDNYQDDRVFLRLLVKEADKLERTLFMRRPGGQDAPSKLRTWMRKELGFQDDEDGCFLIRNPHGKPSPWLF